MQVVTVVSLSCHFFSSPLPCYDKGAGGVFATTRNRLDTATQRAQALAAKFNAYSDPEPFTALHELVTLLTTLRA